MHGGQMDRQTDNASSYVVIAIEKFALYRISVTEHSHQTSNLIFPRGFSSNLMYNVWTVFGGFMMYDCIPLFAINNLNF